MNATELADSLMGWAEDVYGGGETLIEAATMLRTIPALQAEIEALKAVLEQEGIGVGRDLLNGGIALFRKAQENG